MWSAVYYISIIFENVWSVGTIQFFEFYSLRVDPVLLVEVSVASLMRFNLPYLHILCQFYFLSYNSS